MTTYPSTPDQSNHFWTFSRWLIPPLLLLIVILLPQVAPAAALSLPFAWLTSSKAAWYLTRASGTVAYLLLAFSTIWGLLLSGKLVKKRISPVTALAMHNYLSWTAIGLSVVHAVALLFDSYYTYTLASLLIPFIGPFSPLWVGLGIVGLYLMLGISISWFWRKQIGQKNWRKLHYLSFGAYILTTLHGYMAGTDAVALTAMFSISGGAVLFLTLYRILSARSSSK